MAAGGEVPGRRLRSAWSGNFGQQLCLSCFGNKGTVEICVRCEERLCLECLKKHICLMDRESIQHMHISSSLINKCEYKCPVHYDEVLQYYCTSHHLLCCILCKKQDHETCQKVHSIPLVAKELESNEDYGQAEKQLKSMLKTLEKELENAQTNSEELNSSCKEAEKSIHMFRKRVEETLRKNENDLVAKVKDMKLTAEKELAEMRKKYEEAYTSIQLSLEKIEALKNSNQNCSSYIEMMKTKKRLTSLDHHIQNVTVQRSSSIHEVRFFPCGEMFAILEKPSILGEVFVTDTQTISPDYSPLQSSPDSDTGSVSSRDSDDILVLPNDTGSVLPRHSDDISRDFSALSCIEIIASRHSHDSPILSETISSRDSDSISIISDDSGTITPSYESPSESFDDSETVTPRPDIPSAVSDDTETVIPRHESHSAVSKYTGTNIPRSESPSVLSDDTETVIPRHESPSVLSDGTETVIPRPESHSVLSNDTETVISRHESYLIMSDDTRAVISRPDIPLFLSDETSNFISSMHNVVLASVDTGTASSRTGRISVVSSKSLTSMLSDNIAVLSDDTGSVVPELDDSLVLSDGHVLPCPDDPESETAAGSVLTSDDTGKVIPPCRIKIENSGSGRRNFRKVTNIRDLSIGNLYFEIGTDASSILITGMAVLSDHILVLTDYHNDRIKAVDLHNDIIVAELKFSSRTWDITEVNRSKVAVTLPYERKVAFIKVGDNRLRIEKNLAVTGHCWGVDCRYDKLAVSFCEPHKHDRVEVLNLDGIVLYSIEWDKSGQPLFNDPRYVAFGQDYTTLYVSNYRGHSVVCVKVDGTILSKFTDRGLQSPRKAVVDSSGNFYVCASGSNKINYITKDFKRICALLAWADGWFSPCAICLCEVNERLYVGMDNNIVKVYNMEC